ncbi:hypothetical protein AYL99_07585 [Fonsecaea erecta]|uniref:tRNA (guanine(9)-N1)-methyltransferase n=1 Tax=Fonsecaea erecta TaxID=1367422 RepID=A0A178ZHK1_9EURO|nr:hypothetical protein AYL99_07585 [Fonsecaea erecta]OAP58495.1 hypothetical protein AYL99_07585 [Fonsecaea erecta]
MEAEERPAKLRKLDSDNDPGLTEDADTPPLLSNLPGTVTGSADARSMQNSKPEECAANLQDPPDTREEVDGRDESDDLELDSESKPDLSHKAPQQQQDGDASKPLSKNQLKKLKKREEWEAARDYRKAKRKQKIQEKRARKRAAREEEEQNRLQTLQQPSLVGGKGTVGEVDGTKTTTSMPPQQPPPKMKFRRPVQVPMTILIDCGFDELMMEKERISLGSQLTRSYSDNSRTRYQSHLVISSWGGLLKERFDTVLSKHYLNWRNVTFVEGDFVEAAKKAEELMRGPGGGKLVGCFEKHAVAAAAPPAGTESPVVSKDATSQDLKAADNSLRSEEDGKGDGNGLLKPQETATPNASVSAEPGVQHSSPSDPPVPPQGEVIYLTSDSPDTLTTLSPYSTYIVGGLVDKNRHKGICYKTAMARGIKTAKLPIGEYLEMTSRKVLATNHVVEILLRYLEEEDWGKAFLRVIPKRKGGKLRESAAGEGNGEKNGRPAEADDDGAGDDTAEDDYDDDDNDDDNGDRDVNKEEQRNGERVSRALEAELQNQRVPEPEPGQNTNPA